MTENFNCKYLLGICYSCQKCLYCFQFPQQNSCKCEKTKQPSRVKNPKRGQQIYQRSYTPDPSFPKSNEYLLNANTKFNYNSNFEKSFSYTFCGACNSQIQRLRSIDKKAQQAQQAQIEDNDNEMDVSDNEKEVDDGDQAFLLAKPMSDTDEEDDCRTEEEDSDLEEIKVQIIVKSKDIKVPTAKTLTIEPVNYKKIMEKINLTVKKALRRNIKPKDYIISYKVINARGPSSELEDELDFQEFISEYKKAVLAGKKMSMIVDIRNNITKKKTNKHKKVKFFFIYYGI
jgi:hypothetical protein